MQEELKKVNILQIKYTDKKKDGSEMLSKFGKKSWLVDILTDTYEERWAKGFTPFPPDQWKGTEQTLVFFEEEYQGKKYLKFKLQKRDQGGFTQEDRDMLKRVEDKLNYLVKNENTNNN